MGNSTDVIDNAIAKIDKIEEEYVDGILNLSPKMQRFIHLYSTGQYSLAKLATLLEVHPNTLSKWLKRPDVKEVLHSMQESTHQVVGIQIKALSNLAVDRLQKLMSSPIDGVALQAVKDVLDRSGHKPKQEIKVDKTVITYEEKLHSLINNTIDVAEIDVIEGEYE